MKSFHTELHFDLKDTVSQLSVMTTGHYNLKTEWTGQRKLYKAHTVTALLTITLSHYLVFPTSSLTF